MPLPKITFRLSVALQEALSDHVRQHGRQVSDVIRAALETYLGLRPTAGPTTSPASPTLSDAVRDLAARLTALGSDLSDLTTRVDHLEAQAPIAAVVRPGRTTGPTESPTGSPTAVRRKNALPLATLQAIAAARQRYPQLTHRAFAQHLFETGIYRSQGRGGGEAPASSSLIYRWLDEARAAGLLPPRPAPPADEASTA